MLNIPEDKLPNCWKDEHRINALYSPFRSRTVNAKDWDTKISSWKNLIALYCIHNDIYKFTVSDLNKTFTKDGRPPSGLNLVIEEMIKSGEVQPMNNFLEKYSESWSGWAAEVFIKKPITWSYNSIKRSLFNSDRISKEIYVHLEVIQKKAIDLLFSVPEENRNKVMSFKKFIQLTEKEYRHIDNIKLLLHYLINQGKVVLKNFDNDYNNLEKCLIKCSSGNKVNPISETELGTYALQESEKLFLTHVEELENELGRYRKEAKGQLTKGHRQLAKNCLRKMHETEKRIDKKIDVLHNLQTLLSRCQDLHMDSHVLKTYKDALRFFNNTLKIGNLTEDAVENTMLELRDMLDIQENIATSLAQPVIETDEDLEQELSELLASEESEAPVKDPKLNNIEEELNKLIITPIPNQPIVDNTPSKELSFQ